jgi:hypothetical protein
MSLAGSGAHRSALHGWLDGNCQLQEHTQLVNELQWPFQQTANAKCIVAKSHRNHKNTNILKELRCCNLHGDIPGAETRRMLYQMQAKGLVWLHEHKKGRIDGHTTTRSASSWHSFPADLYVTTALPPERSMNVTGHS